MAKLTVRLTDKIDTDITLQAKKAGISRSEFIRSALTKKSNLSSVNSMELLLDLQTKLKNIALDVNELNKSIHDNTNKTLLGNQLICQLLLDKFTPEKLTKLVADLQANLNK